MLHVRVYPDLNSAHASQVYSGLFELAKEGKITLELTDEFEERIRKSARNSVLCVQVSPDDDVLDARARILRAVDTASYRPLLIKGAAMALLHTAHRASNDGAISTYASPRACFPPQSPRV